MGFLNTVVKLLDEDSDEAFEKKMGSALDKIEQVLGATVDKAESGIKIAENGIKKVDNAGKVVENSVQKVDQVSRTAMDVVNKKTTES